MWKHAMNDPKNDPDKAKKGTFSLPLSEAGFVGHRSSIAHLRPHRLFLEAPWEGADSTQGSSGASIARSVARQLHLKSNPLILLCFKN
jgi:hypothetical protein